MNLAAIHIRAKEAGLDDAAYRDLLLRVAGVRSAKELDEDQYLAVMREIWALINAQNSRRRAPRKKSPAESKIWAIWYQELCPYLEPRCRNVRYLAGIIEHRIGRNILSDGQLLTSLLDRGELHQAIEALKKAADQRQKPPRRLRQPCPSLSPSGPASLPPSPVLNEFGNDVQAHPELAEVPF